MAAWIRFLRGLDDAGRPVAVNDPLAAALQAAALGEDPVGAVLTNEEVFAPELAGDMRFREAVFAGYRAICEKGVRGTLEDWT